MAASQTSVASELWRRAVQELSQPRALAALAAGSALWYLWRLRRRSALGKFPEVPGLPVIGVLHKVETDRFIETLEKWSREYGKEEGVFELSMVGERMVVFSDWEACQPILAGRPFKITRPDYYCHIGLVNKEIGVFFAEGRQWSTQRRLVSPGFNAKAIESYLPAVCTIVENLLGVLRSRVAEGKAANVTEIFRKLNADVISKVAFGQDYGALHGKSTNLEDVVKFMDAFITRMVSPVPYWNIPFLRHWDSGEQAYTNIRTGLSKLLTDPTAATDTTLLGKLMSVEGEKLTHDELLGNVFVLFLAGTDTTSHSLAFAAYELARQPELQEAVAAEVAKLPAGLAGAQRLDELLLTRALWLETLRVHNVAPALDLETQEPIVVKGRTLPPKTPIWLLFREMCRNSAEYRAALGKDFDAFRPQRWLAPGGGLVECKPLDAIAFGHGARACVGKNLANLVGPLVLAEIMRNFRIERWEGGPLRERTSFVQCADRDVEVRFVAREG